uniref:Uncharacterized protein n=1 Tax=Heliothis virescens TaxID=7102 RepID=A0A2A4JSK2_HELVI
MKTIIIIFLFITITAGGVLKDEEISRRTQYYYPNIVVVADSNEESPTTHTEVNEAGSRIQKREITQTSTTNDAELQDKISKGTLRRPYITLYVLSSAGCEEFHVPWPKRNHTE